LQFRRIRSLAPRQFAVFRTRVGCSTLSPSTIAA